MYFLWAAFPEGPSLQLTYTSVMHFLSEYYSFLPLQSRLRALKLQWSAFFLEYNSTFMMFFRDFKMHNFLSMFNLA